MLVGTINAVVAGVLAGLVAEALDASTTIAVVVGVMAGLGYVAVLSAVPVRQIARILRERRPRFPSPDSETS